MTPEREHCPVPGDDHVSMTASSTLENAIIGVVRQDLESTWWKDNNTQISQEDCSPAQLIGIAGELAGQDSQKFVDDPREMTSSSSPSRTLLTAASDRLPGKTKAETKMLVSKTTLNR